MTDRLAEFAVSTRFEQLPAEAVTAGKQGFLDNLGVALIGSREQDIQMMLKMVRDGGDKGRGTVVGTRVRVSPLNAAMINGQATHALDFDDTQHGCATHVSPQ